MPVLEGPVSTLLGEVGLGVSVPLHTTDRPWPWKEFGQVQGHYRVVGRFNLVASQAAASNFWAFRVSNPRTVIVPTRYEVRWTQTGNVTAAIRHTTHLYKMRNFTAIPTGNSQILTPSSKRTVMGPPTIECRCLVAAGASAGMSGGTGGGVAPISQMDKWFLLTLDTAARPVPTVKEMLDDVNGTHPFTLAQNEGLMLTNDQVAVFGAIHSSSMTVDFSYAEVLAS